MNLVAIPEVAEQLLSLLERVENGERIILTRDGRVVAELAPPRDDPVAEAVYGRIVSLSERTPKSPRSSTELVRDMRDERD